MPDMMSALPVSGLMETWVLPVLLAVIACTVLWPPVRWLRKKGLPPAVAVLMTLSLAVVVIAGVVAAVTPARNIVLANRGAICWATEVRTPESSPTKLAKFAWAKELPRSPCNAPASH